MQSLANIFVFVAVLCGSCTGQMSRDALRAALSQDPLFSHQRDRAMPVMQNVNIKLPVNDPSLQQQQSVDPIPEVVSLPVQAQSRVQAGPATQEIRTFGPVDTQFRAVEPQSQAQVNPPLALHSRMGGPISAGRPIRENELILGQVAPTRVAQTQPTTEPQTVQEPVVNNRILSEVRPATRSASTDQQLANSKLECSFQIPSFLLPDPDPSQLGNNMKCPSFLLPGPTIDSELINLMVEHWTGVASTQQPKLQGVRSQINQVEFEQKCLIPALRAHVLGGPACRTRELKVYLEWLLYLRQKLFNI